MRRYECVNAPLLTATRFVGGTAAPSPPRPAPAPSPRPAGRPVGPSSVDSARRLFGAIVLFSTSASRPLPPALAPPPVLVLVPVRFFPRFSSFPLPSPPPALSFYLILFSRTRALLVPIPPRPLPPPALPARRLIDGTSLKRYRYPDTPHRRSLVIVARVSRASPTDD